jgi:hypothetical protein
MSSRPDIELALDIRSYEKIVVLTGQDSSHQYPDEWIRPAKLSDLEVNEESVVVVDRVELQRKTIAQIAEGKPRLVAFAVANVDHEKQVRRMVTSLFPWNEVWTVFTSFGKLLITKDVKGLAYDRDEIVDVFGPNGQA